jgi:hypothetical protein
MNRIPPIHALLAFESAARHGSMTAAAQELSVTPSAISHRIKQLEVFIGQTLIERSGAQWWLRGTIICAWCVTAWPRCKRCRARH